MQSSAIPFNFVSSLIGIRAEVAGKEAHLLLDTGFAGLALNSEFVQKAGLQSAKRNARIFTSATLYKGPVIALENVPLVIGGDSLTVPIVIAPDMSGLEADAHLDFDGILGSSLFLTRRITIDYATRVITLDGPPIVPAGGAFVSTICKKLLPLVHARVLDSHNKWIKADFLIDTGSDDTIEFNAPYVRKHRDLFLEGSVRASEQKSRGIYGQAAFSNGLLRSLALGPIRLQKLAVTLPQVQSGVLASKGVAGALGNALLCHYRLTVDYLQGEVVLEPRSSEAATINGSLPPCDASSAAGPQAR